MLPNTTKTALKKTVTYLVVIITCALLNMGSDDHTQNWCKLVATVSTSFCGVMFTPIMRTQHTIMGTVCKRVST